MVVHGKLDDNVTVRRHVAATLQKDRCAQWNIAGISATHVVIPQGGCCDVRRYVSQANDEVVGSVCYKKKHNFVCSSVHVVK